MKTIHKFPLFGTYGDQVVMPMPAAAKILTIQLQGGVPTIWAEVDSEAPKESRLIASFGTGRTLPSEPGQYIATIQDGAFVWHFYDRTSNS